MPHGPSRPPHCKAGCSHGKARQRDRCAQDAANSDDDLTAYVKEVVDSLPPLTDEQRDQLALIFRSRLVPSDNDNRRVIAALRYLES